MVDIEFKDAILSEAPMIAALHTSSWQKHYRGLWSDHFLENEAAQNRLEKWTELLSHIPENQLVRLALLDGRLAGFICAYDIPNDQFGYFVDNLHVKTKYKGMGIGKKLMSEVAKWGIERKAHSGLYLWVLEGNLEAQAFYCKIGGQIHSLETVQTPYGEENKEYRFVWPDISRLLV